MEDYVNIVNEVVYHGDLADDEIVQSSTHNREDNIHEVIESNDNIFEIFDISTFKEGFCAIKVLERFSIEHKYDAFLLHLTVMEDKLYNSSVKNAKHN